MEIHDVYVIYSDTQSFGLYLPLQIFQRLLVRWKVHVGHKNSLNPSTQLAKPARVSLSGVLCGIGPSHSVHQPYKDKKQPQMLW